MARSNLILVEGVPGAGKTSLSAGVSEDLLQRAIPSCWHVEEARDHPVTGRDIRAMHRRDDFDEVCLAQWSQLVSSPHAGVCVLDGCAMQSTVRFMFEQGWPLTRIRDYWSAFIGVVQPLAPTLVYLRHPDLRDFLATHTRPVRAMSWDRIASHVEQTPMGRSLANDGWDAPVEFWVRYGQLCDDLVARWTLPLLPLDVSRGWTELAGQVVSWIEAED